MLLERREMAMRLHGLPSMMMPCDLVCFEQGRAAWAYCRQMFRLTVMNKVLVQPVMFPAAFDRSSTELDGSRATLVQ